MLGLFLCWVFPETCGRQRCGHVGHFLDKPPGRRSSPRGGTDRCGLPAWILWREGARGVAANGGPARSAAAPRRPFVRGPRRKSVDRGLMPGRQSGRGEKPRHPWTRPQVDGARRGPGWRAAILLPQLLPTPDDRGGGDQFVEQRQGCGARCVERVELGVLEVFEQEARVHL